MSWPERPLFEVAVSCTAWKGILKNTLQVNYQALFDIQEISCTL